MKPMTPVEKVLMVVACVVVTFVIGFGAGIITNEFQSAKERSKYILIERKSSENRCISPGAKQTDYGTPEPPVPTPDEALKAIGQY